jgi:hypothetical protein
MSWWISADYTWAWARAFVFTQAVEAPMYRWALGVSLGQALLPSALTHPALWFWFFPRLAPSLGLTYRDTTLLSEVLVWWSEALVLTAVCRKKPPRLWAYAGWAFVANGTSLLLGLGCRRFFGLP